MTKFLCVQHVQDGIEVALFQDQTIIQKVFEDKKRSSKYFVPTLNTLLQDCATTLGDLSFIAANRGPGPFTTLRVVLASVNGLALASNKPLIGIDGLDALLLEHRKPECPLNIALLDAYSKDVYYGIDYKDNPEFQKGYKNISVFLAELQNFAKEQENNSHIYFMGNGAEKYKEDIVAIFGDKVLFGTPIIPHCSIEQVGKMAFAKWEKQEGLTDQLLPLYLKSRMF